MEPLPWQPGEASPWASRLSLGRGVLRKGGWEQRGWGGGACSQSCLPPKGRRLGPLSSEEGQSLCGPIPQSRRGGPRKNREQSRPHSGRACWATAVAALQCPPRTFTQRALFPHSGLRRAGLRRGPLPGAALQTLGCAPCCDRRWEWELGGWGGAAFSESERRSLTGPGVL